MINGLSFRREREVVRTIAVRLSEKNGEGYESVKGRDSTRLDGHACQLAQLGVHGALREVDDSLSPYEEEYDLGPRDGHVGG